MVRTPAPRTPGEGRAGRAPFDRSTIVDGVLRLAQDDPQASITFRRLGEELGVDATAMYRHFRGKDEILQAAIDRLYQQALDRVDRAEPSWRARLEDHAERMVEVFLEYPSLGQQAPTLDGHGWGEIASIEFLLSCFREAGLEGEALMSAYAALANHCLAQSAALAREPRRPGRGPDEAFAPWLTEIGVTDLSSFPLVAEHQSALLGLDAMDVYRAGVAAILDAAERAGRSGHSAQV